MFDFHHLYVFVNVVQQKSFSRAAETVFLSQSTVSSHIQSLERKLNVKLFDRIGKDVILTPAGEKLYSWAVDILAMRERALYDLRNYFQDVRGKIKVASSTVPGEYILPELIGKFQKKYPQVIFKILQKNSQLVAEDVLEGAAEIGFLGAKFKDKKLEFIHVADDELILITPKNYTFPGDKVTIQTIREQPLILRNPGSGTQKVLEKALMQKKVSLGSFNIRAYFDSTEAVKQAVKCGLGVAIVSKRAVRDYIEGDYVNAYNIAGLDLKREFLLVYHRERTLSPACEVFISLLKKGEFFREECICR